jgi:hypothetical protein
MKLMLGRRGVLNSFTPNPSDLGKDFCMELMAQIGTQEVVREFTASTQEHGLSWDNAEAWQIQPSQLMARWLELKPFIDEWVKVTNGEMTTEDVLGLVLKRLMYLIVIHARGEIKLVSFMEFIQYPQKKVLRMIGFVGEKPIIAQKFMPAIETWARMNGASALETFATPETEKFDKRLGFEPVYRLMRKAL